MKEDPTNTDREAVALFSPVCGMRISLDGYWYLCIPSTHDFGIAMLAEESATTPPRERAYSLSRGGVVALDVDDPATVGTMLTQVGEAAGEAVEIVSSWGTFQVHATRGKLGEGPTRGAALVAAMRELRKAGTK